MAQRKRGISMLLFPDKTNKGHLLITNKNRKFSYKTGSIFSLHSYRAPKCEGKVNENYSAIYLYVVFRLHVLKNFIIISCQPVK